ncbi:caspase family protein [Sphingobium olei]|uniref:Caspase family protein n=1 Tax=Sphingobium olei TaxID=420955 RepID=A0ABW3NU30_9SPHN
MNLKPVGDEDGLWRAGEANQAGVHAFVLGISDYPHLSGGSAPPEQRAQDNGGLGQLEVSALSAARIFEWLANAPEIVGAPLASCRLHLAPRPDERDQVLSLSREHIGKTDLRSVQPALLDWASEMAHAGRLSDEPNVALLFFSGHGVEVMGNQAFLLSDVLNPMAIGNGAGSAVAVDPLMRAVKTFNVDRGLFFIDACRDDPVIARLLHIVGSEPLKPVGASTRRAKPFISLQSTGAGQNAFQMAGDNGTLFTKAVLSGLEGLPPNFAPYDTSGLPWSLRFAALETHVKQTVAEALRDHNALDEQAVEPHGIPYDGTMIVATRDGPPPDAGRFSIVDPPPRPSLEESVSRLAKKAEDGGRTFDHDDIDNMRYQGFRGIGGLPADLANLGLLRRMIDKDTASILANSLSLRDAATSAEVPLETITLFQARTQETTEQSVTWLDFLLAPGRSSVWLSLRRADDNGMVAVTIPRDLGHPMPVRMEIRLGRYDGRTVVDRMRARLADPAGAKTELPEQWSALFHAQRTQAFADTGSAAQKLANLVEMRDVVMQKRLSPVAAALAAGLLLRAGATDQLSDWPRNLADWFPYLADAPILWAETILQRTDMDRPNLADPTVREAFHYFMMAAERGPPLLATSLAMAVRQAAIWRAVAAPGIASTSHGELFNRAIGRIEAASRFMASGGAFASFVSIEREMTPADVLGFSTSSPDRSPMLEG